MLYGRAVIAKGGGEPMQIRNMLADNHVICRGVAPGATGDAVVFKDRVETGAEPGSHIIAMLLHGGIGAFFETGHTGRGGERICIEGAWVNDLLLRIPAGFILEHQVFHDFGYARLGLKCRLDNNVCHMGGVDPIAAGSDSTGSTGSGSIGSGSAGAGYTIVEGSGLPRITVVGFQREVDWPTLVSRLKAATEGNGPVIK